MCEVSFSSSESQSDCGECDEQAEAEKTQERPAPYLGGSFEEDLNGHNFVCDPVLDRMVRIPSKNDTIMWKLVYDPTFILPDGQCSVRLVAPFNPEIKTRYVHDLMNCSKAMPLECLG